MDNKLSYELKEFNRLCKEMDEIYHKLALKSGLSDSAFYVLYAVVEMGDGCLQKDISQNYSLSRQTINSSVKNLIEKGYISLMQGNGRDKHIHLTDSGRRLIKNIIFPVIEMENEAFNEMLPNERKELLRLTEKYIHLLRQKAEHFKKTD